MNTIKDEVRIKTTAAKAYEALSTQAGYRGWWNAVAEVPANVGGEAKLHFIKDGNDVRMRYSIDTLTPNEHVRWTCIGHDMASWIGTTLDWQIRGSGNEVVVVFEHAGWKDAAPEQVAMGWKHFVSSLKAYLETGTGQPW